MSTAPRGNIGHRLGEEQTKPLPQEVVARCDEQAALAAEDARCGQRWEIRDALGRYWVTTCIRRPGHDSRCVDSRGRVGV